MKGHRTPMIWIAPDGWALWGESSAALARKLGCCASNFYACTGEGSRCMGGRVMLDDGRPSHANLDKTHLAMVVKNPRGWKLARIVNQEIATAEQERLTNEQIWAERDKYLADCLARAERQRKRRAKAEKKAKKHTNQWGSKLSVEWLPGPIASLPRASRGPAREYLNAKLSKVEKETIARQARIKRLPHTTGYFLRDFSPAICPVCGKLITGVKKEIDDHFIAECKAAVKEGREVAIYPGGVIRVTKEPTGFVQDFTMLYR